MIRVMWMGLFCLAAICIIAAVATAPSASVSASIENVADSTPIAFRSNVQQAAPGKADKLPVAIEAPSANQVIPIKSLAVEPPPSAPATTSERIVSRHWHDPNPLVASGNSAARRQPKNQKGTEKRTAAESTSENRSCPAGTALFRTLKLLPDCETTIATTNEPSR